MEMNDFDVDYEITGKEEDELLIYLFTKVLIAEGEVTRLTGLYKHDILFDINLKSLLELCLTEKFSVAYGNELHQAILLFTEEARKFIKTDEEYEKLNFLIREGNMLDVNMEQEIVGYRNLILQELVDRNLKINKQSYNYVRDNYLEFLNGDYLGYIIFYLSDSPEDIKEKYKDVLDFSKFKLDNMIKNSKKKEIIYNKEEGIGRIKVKIKEE